MTETTGPLIGGIDGGGTTFKCALASAEGELIRAARFPVTTPKETLRSCADFLTKASKGRPLAALGIACFGPLDVDPSSPQFGSLLSTPKPGWSNFNIRKALADGLQCPVAIDTDVNGALLAEMKDGAARGTRSAAYVTVGTGIGAGVFTGGDFLARPGHPEFGHIRVERHPDDTYTGHCVFHGGCLEGMASAPALKARFGEPSELEADHPAWDLEAFYLAQGCITLSLTIRPEKIVLGGGILQAEGLIEKVRTQYVKLMNGYLGMCYETVQQMIVAAGLGDEAGTHGGLWLARSLLPESGL